jgi:hypothetical protein
MLWVTYLYRTPGHAGIKVEFGLRLFDFTFGIRFERVSSCYRQPNQSPTVYAFDAHYHYQLITLFIATQPTVRKQVDTGDAGGNKTQSSGSFT